MKVPPVSRVVALLFVSACASQSASVASSPSPSGAAPSPDPRVGLKPGVQNAGQAAWNMRLVSATPPSQRFAGGINSDLAFLGKTVIQGSFSGYQVWDISNPARPALKTAYFCPASQSDVSVYRNLLFVSGEDLSARIDCGSQGIPDSISKDRLRGIRIFDISDIANPKNVGNVQTCRGSHTHTLVVDPRDSENVYVYISGSSGVRSPSELPGCLSSPTDPNSALFRIEVIKVPLARPQDAAVVNSPRIFADLGVAPSHGESKADVDEAAAMAAGARARGMFTAKVFGTEQPIPPQFVQPLLDSVVRARGGSGAPTSRDSAALRAVIQKIVDHEVGADQPPMPPTQCHDITVYPAIGRAGGACEGYGFLLDISDPVRPVRMAAAADSNFSYWHSATFNNDGSKILFSDEWGGGSGAKCRATDKLEWGADAIFTIENGKMQFRSYFKMPAPQTAAENCVAHNGSLIPIPGRDVMVQAWYQGGISVFDWTDPAHPREIAFFDRGPLDPTRLVLGGSWSVYWYNGVMVSSEIVRGLDILELMPSPFISQNEIDAARSVQFDYLNVQGQQKIVWPPSFALARAYLDQLERSKGLSYGSIGTVRTNLNSAEALTGTARRDALMRLANQLGRETNAADAAKVRILADAVSDLAGATR